MFKMFKHVYDYFINTKKSIAKSVEMNPSNIDEISSRNKLTTTVRTRKTVYRTLNCATIYIQIIYIYIGHVRDKYTQRNGKTGF